MGAQVNVGEHTKRQIDASWLKLLASQNPNFSRNLRLARNPIGYAVEKNRVDVLKVLSGLTCPYVQMEEQLIEDGNGQGAQGSNILHTLWCRQETQSIRELFSYLRRRTEFKAQVVAKA